MSAFDAAPCPWDGFTPGTVRFCEDRMCAWIREPANTWSNMGFVVLGVWLFYRAKKDDRGPLWLIGSTSFLVGVGSYLFHMSGALFGEFLDLAAMFLISALMLTLESQRFLNWSRAAVVRLYVMIAASSIVLMAAVRTAGIPLFTVEISGVYILQFAQWKWRPGVRYGYARAMGGVFLLGFVVWILDLTRTVCRPDNHVFTGHSFWHLASAASLWLYYKYQEQFVSGQGADEPQPLAVANP